jgi:rhodanese-related sulfurtransferase
MYQETFEDTTGVTVETVLLHESGESIRCGKLHVPAPKQDPQGYGSALSYARRYSLMAACGIAPEDDDGNHASQPIKPKYVICDAAIRQPAVAAAHSQAGGASEVAQPPVALDAPIIWNAGKPPHRGKNIREVDGSYLKWYEANGPQDEYRVKASQELDRRDLEQDANREMMP